MRAMFATAIVGLGLLATGCSQADPASEPAKAPEEASASPDPAPAAATAEESSPDASSPAAASLQLEGSGVRIAAADGTSTLLSFGDAQAATEQAVSDALVAQPERMNGEECGAGPMQFAKFPGLSLNFQDGSFVGWYADGEAPAVTDKGVRIGMTRAESERRVDEFTVADSTLGTEFTIGGGETDWIGGFLEEGKVSGLYAGTNCFFR